MKALLIGGTRFIGPAVVEELLRRGAEVVCFHRQTSAAGLPPGVRHIQGDRRALADHAAALRAVKPDVVIDMIPFFAADAAAVMNVFRGHAGRVVAVSSVDVYRAYGILIGVEPGGIEPMPLTEDSPLRDVLYPLKAMAPNLADYDKILVERAVLGDPELPGAVMRLPFVFGPRDGQRRFAGWLRRMRAGRPAIVLAQSHADWRSSWCYVEHAAQAIVLAALTPAAAGRAYHVADACPPRQADAVTQVARAAGWQGRVLIVPDERLPESLRPKERFAQHLEVKSHRVRDELGFAETLDVQECLRRTIAWEDANPPASLPAEDYSDEDAVIAAAGIS